MLEIDKMTKAQLIEHNEELYRKYKKLCNTKKCMAEQIKGLERNGFIKDRIINDLQKRLDENNYSIDINDSYFYYEGND